MAVSGTLGSCTGGAGVAVVAVGGRIAAGAGGGGAAAGGGVRIGAAGGGAAGGGRMGVEIFWIAGLTNSRATTGGVTVGGSGTAVLTGVGTSCLFGTSSSFFATAAPAGGDISAKT